MIFTYHLKNSSNLMRYAYPHLRILQTCIILQYLSCFITNESINKFSCFGFGFIHRMKYALLVFILPINSWSEFYRGIQIIILENEF